MSEQTEAPSLGIQDIQNAVRIIDYAADQGAFKGWQTIEQVQTVRNRLAAFTAYAESQKQAEDTSSADAPADSSEEVAPVAEAAV